MNRFVLLPIYFIFVGTLSAEPLITLSSAEERALITGTHTLATYDDTELLGLGKDVAMAHLLTPRVELKTEHKDLLAAAQTVIRERLICDDTFVLAPWMGVCGTVLAQIKEGGDRIPLAETFALSHIRAIPGWDSIFDRLQAEAVRRNIAILSLDEE